MEESSAGRSEIRAVSLSRSRSRGRNPTELLARRQQLLNGVNSQANHQSELVSANWQTSNSDFEPDERVARDGPHRRSQTRRAKQLERQSGAYDRSGADELRAKSVEAKLESLSQLLKSHQQENGYQEQQSPTGSNSNAKSIDDVYILLAKKEKDLQLAAELGKVLLEKNDELSKANERITEEYSQKLELLEQDKYKLKRKLDLLDGEYENRLIELQTDCNILKNQLDEQQQLARQTEKEKSKLIDDLVQQNQRLTSELVEATKSEELLSSQLEQMSDRFNVRMSNRQDHVVQLDALKEEIQIVNQRKQDLERRLKLANQDKSNLNTALGDSGDKILLLENLLNEKDGKLSELMEEINELRDSSSWLSNELEEMINLNEKLVAVSEETALDQQDTPAGSVGSIKALGQRKRSQLVEHLKELRLKNKSRLKANEFMLITRRTANGQQVAARGSQLASKLDRRSREASAARRSAQRAKRSRDASLFDEMESSESPPANKLPTSMSASWSHDDDDDDADTRRDDACDSDWTGEVAVEIFDLLKRFHSALQHRRDGFLSQSYLNAAQLSSPNSADDSGISADDIDKATSEQAKDLALWKRLLSSLKSLIEEMPCSTCQLMIGERAEFEQLQKVHSRLCDEMRRKGDELLALSVAKTEQDTKLAALEERCNILSNDLSNCDKPKEEIVKLAWKARDEAVERKNNAEISLAKTRIENMQISSQLMEVVQQKGELSQKLAQFEDDIHYITQDSVKAKFTWEEYAEKLRSRQTQPASSNAGYNSNPLSQLLNFSVASSRDTNGASAANRPSAKDNLVTQPASLMRNFTSSRFNLRFWQRSSATTTKSTSEGSTATANTTTEASVAQ